MMHLILLLALHFGNTPCAPGFTRGIQYFSNRDRGVSACIEELPQKAMQIVESGDPCGSDTPIITEHDGKIHLECPVKQSEGKTLYCMFWDGDAGYQCATEPFYGWATFHRASGEEITIPMWTHPKPQPPEAVDVPAIQTGACKLTDKQVKDGYCCYRDEGWQMDCPREVSGHWTCADKNRILETAEDGAHWCRKVQP